MVDQGFESRAAIAREAADWYVAMRDPDRPEGVKSRFTNWLLESPIHVDEYLAVASLYEDLGAIDSQRDIDVDSLVPENVVPLDSRPNPLMERDTLRVAAISWKRGAIGLGATLVLVTALAFSLYWPDEDVGETTSYTTARGEQRSITLNDGSILTLNALTEIDVTVSDRSRYVSLRSGDVLFDIKPDDGWPFFVEARSVLVKVTGTQFNMSIDRDTTSVTLLHGSMRIIGHAEQTQFKSSGADDAFGEDSEAIDLKVGEHLVIATGGAILDRQMLPNPESVTAWTRRQLIFDNDQISDVVAQFNRYNRKQLVINDPDLQKLRLSGVFDANDLDSFVLYLEHAYGANVAVLPYAEGK